jgi:hypothetical protein
LEFSKTLKGGVSSGLSAPMILWPLTFRRYRVGMSQFKAPKSASPRRPAEEPVPPGVKAWLDNLIVPALVKQWLAERREESANQVQRCAARRSNRPSPS